MKIILFQTYLLTIISTISCGDNVWPGHDTSTLKLLQIVHRHGDRAPEYVLANDPYYDPKYWPYGWEQLTTKGKYRMYKIGEFIRNAYCDYLGDQYSPREVYARSSSVERVLESCSCVLAGAYPPRNPIWQWNMGSDAELGKFWQPIGIQTIINASDDIVLQQERSCPLVDRLQAKIYNRPYLKKFWNVLSKTYAEQNIGKIVGYDINTWNAANKVFDTLSIEASFGYYWNNVWTNEQELAVINQLYYGTLIKFRYNWDNCVVRRLMTGGLVRLLNDNIKSVINNTNTNKLYVYGTHDTDIGALLAGLDISNYRPVPFGATVLLELHETIDSDSKCNYFVKAFYINETVIDSELPFELTWRACGDKNYCPIDRYFSFTKYLLFDNFDAECNAKKPPKITCVL